MEYALTLQPHRALGHTIGFFLLEETANSGIFSIRENLLTRSDNQLNSFGASTELIKLLREISDRELHRQFGKNSRTLAIFFDKLKVDKNLEQYIVEFVERRISKIFTLAASLQIPVILRDTGSKTVNSHDTIEVIPEKATPVFHFSLSDSGLVYTISVYHNNREILLQGDNRIICNSPCIALIGKKLYAIDDIEGKKILPFFTRSEISIPQTATRKYLQTFVLNQIRNRQVEAKGFSIETTMLPGKAVLNLEYNLAGNACFTLSFRYGSKTYLSNAPVIPEVTLEEHDGQFTFNRFERNVNWEKELLIRLGSLGLKKVGEVHYAPEQSIGAENSLYELVEWTNNHANRLAELAIEITQNIGKTRYYLKPVALQIEVSGFEDWFDLYGMVKAGEFEIPFINFKRNILRGIREYVLPDGQVLILPDEWFARYRPILQIAKETGDKLRVPKAIYTLLSEKGLQSDSLDKLKEEFDTHILSQITVPANFVGELRDYQLIGFRWLKFLEKNGLNGYLADDMGLGKTIQALILLQSSFEEHNYATGMNRTSLVVAPKSLLPNWLNESKKFTPKLNVSIHQGSQRSNRPSELYSHHIIVVSYDTLRNDIDLFRELRFNWVILDESQHIKNPLSKRYRAAALLNYKHALCLSGTPVENNLVDLWAQFNFLNRNMLGSLHTFRKEYQQPIERNGDENKEALLKRMVSPLILRRTKEEVVKELPPITEQIVHCEMSDSQYRIYEEEKSMVRNTIMEAVATDKLEKSKLSVLAGLTRLRQIANHPCLLDDYQTADSGKFEEVTRMLTEVIDENHKVLVFSSFVKHLELLESYLKQSNINYEKLTGATRNRSEIIDSFQKNKDIRVFLISLKAGGVGLNLTAADYVFILDPWWNPAAEMQATARSHRIGQTQSVFVYRFITRGTVEEKIVKLQERKDKLASQFKGSTHPLELLDSRHIIELVE